MSEAKQRFEQIRGLPGADTDGALRDLLDMIDDLAMTFEQETIHQKRLIAVMVERTGAEPLASGTKPVNTYQDLLTHLDEALHTKVTLEAVAGLWVEALALLRQLFLPPDARHQELTRLAELEKPAQADVVTLKSLLAAPSHLQYFLAKIHDPSWLELLDSSGLLEPVGGQSVWPVFAAVERLGEMHADRLSALLATMFDRWGADPEKAFAIARAALELGVEGQDVVLRSAQRHPTALALAWVAVEAAQKADPADEFVQAGRRYGHFQRDAVWRRPVPQAPSGQLRQQVSQPRTRLRASRSSVSSSGRYRPAIITGRTWRLSRRFHR